MYHSYRHVGPPTGYTCMVQPNKEAQLRELAEAVYGVSHRIRQLQLNDPIDKATLAVLWRVTEHGDLRPSTVAAELGLDMSTISRHVRALHDDGYVGRTPDPDDGRACRLSATPAGAELVRQAWERRIHAISAAVASWPEADREALTRLLVRLADDLRHALQDPPPAAPRPDPATSRTAAPAEGTA
jgi:DNA-binding MarR family transcriptional regulator